MTVSDNLPWQVAEWEHLMAYAQQDRMPHALLVYGQQGLGKQYLVQRFANFLLCSADDKKNAACGHCPSCLLMQAHTHPDFYFLAPIEPSEIISIEQIRTLLQGLSLTSHFNLYRIIIVNQAHTMNVNAANAFLKYLEEPVERTLIVLITDQYKRLPATIVSRCQKLPVMRPAHNQVLSWLQLQKSDATVDDIKACLSLANNAPYMALTYLSDDTLSLRNACYKEWLAVAKQRQHPVIVAEQWVKLTKATLLAWMISWVIDMTKFYFTAQPLHLFNPDLNNSLQAFAKQLELKELIIFYDLLLISQQRMVTQINNQSIYEEILIAWFNLNSAQKHDS